MSTTSNAPAQDQNLKRLEERLKKLQNEMNLQRQSAASSSRISLIVGIIALAALGGYFLYGYSAIAEVTEPKKLIDVAQQMMDDKIPEARKSIEEQIRHNAPVWASSLSTQAQSSLPVVREKLEDYVLDQVDKVAENVSFVTEEQFRSYLKENKESLQAGFKELGENPKLAEESLAQLEAALEQHLQANMRDEAHEVFGTLLALNEKLRKLQVGKGLNADEDMERKILRMARRLQIERADADLLKKHEKPVAGSEDKGKKPADDETVAKDDEAKAEDAKKDEPEKESAKKESADNKKNPDPEEKKEKAGDS